MAEARKNPVGASHARSGGHMADFMRILISLLVPPLGVALQVGLTKHFWINIVLTILGYVPGVVHAAYIIGSRD